MSLASTRPASVGPAPAAHARAARMRALRRAGRWAAIAFGAVVLALAFVSYLSPDMAFTLMTQAWSCL